MVSWVFSSSIRGRKNICWAPRTLWERACSRWGRYIQHLWQLIHRYREQARSHRGMRCPCY
ncbi:hypothetical protein C1X64_30305 [Pseudomonas sp. GW456-E7]|nr:hypothetical protein C1X64_30305 [Pseudomonas sp. GW456-E7]